MIKKVVIVGGGFAGWYTACSLQHCMPHLDLVIVESDKFPIMSVGEATTFGAPHYFRFLLGLADDSRLMEMTGASYKYGTRAVNFYQDNTSFDSPKFLKKSLSSLLPAHELVARDISIYQAWLSINRNSGKGYSDYIIETTDLYNFPKQRVMKFDESVADVQPFGYHLDAATTSLYLRELTYSRNNGKLSHLIGTVVDIEFDGNDVRNLVLDDGRKIDGDLIIDASGLGRVVIGKTENRSWEDSPEWENNACWFAPTGYRDPSSEMLPISVFTGEDWGWRFRTPLYHRVGNGYIFNTNFVDPKDPLSRMNEVLGDSLLKDPQFVRWKPGQYTSPWFGNVVPVGMAAGIIDPFDAPVFESHSRSLMDLLPILGSSITMEKMRETYNSQREIPRRERELRMAINFGMSKRPGPFWESRRNLARDMIVGEEIKKFVLENRDDLSTTHHWHLQHIYSRIALGCGLDMSTWEFIELTPIERNLAESFFLHTRARNEYIGKSDWVGYYDWIKENRFGGATSDEILQKINPGLVRNNP